MSKITPPLKYHGGKADLAKSRVGRLLVVERVGNDTRGRSRWLCKCDCGKSKVIAGRELRRALKGGERKGTRSCGCLVADSVPRGKSHPWFGKRISWKGGRTKTSKGYILLWNPEHPNAYKSGYVYEHVFVMSWMLGRPLASKESVHHINGDRADNRIQNLELWSKSHPPGQRVEDKVRWAKEILGLYQPEALA